VVRRGVRTLPERVLPRTTSTSPALTSAQKQRTCSVFKAAGASQRTQRLVAIALQRPVPASPRDLRGPEPCAPLLSAFKEVHAAAAALAPQVPGFFPLKLAVLLAYARSIFPALTDSVFFRSDGEACLALRRGRVRLVREEGRGVSSYYRGSGRSCRSAARPRRKTGETPLEPTLRSGARCMC
jgi:hypothetical protein